MQSLYDIYEDFIVLYWLNWCGVSLNGDEVGVEPNSTLTQSTGNETPPQLSHRWITKKFDYVGKFKKTNQKYSKALFFGVQYICVGLIRAMNQNMPVYL
jgi:hypothetical protein